VLVFGHDTLVVGGEVNRMDAAGVGRLARALAEASQRAPGREMAGVGRWAVVTPMEAGGVASGPDRRARSIPGPALPPPRDCGQ
jgi:hypothetical protein